MISTSDISNGVNFKIDDQIFSVIWFQHHKPGKGGAMVRLKLKNLRTGAIIETTVKSGEKFEEVILNKKKMQFLYKEGLDFVFMDNETFDQIRINPDHIGESAKFLQDNMEVDILFYQDEILGIQLPSTVILEVIYTEQGLKGDTQTGAVKPATLETGAEINVPLFINVGDKLKIDTRTGEYVQRV
ncbi:MAG: elongation factor P [Elusimicrobiota bacterium]|jgi:elongation factor P|nr:elongation factor P [Elusimicrobiota bacterium]